MHRFSLPLYHMTPISELDATMGAAERVSCTLQLLPDPSEGFYSLSQFPLSNLLVFPAAPSHEDHLLLRYGIECVAVKQHDTISEQFVPTLRISIP